MMTGQGVGPTLTRSGEAGEVGMEKKVVALRVGVDDTEGGGEGQWAMKATQTLQRWWWVTWLCSQDSVGEAACGKGGLQTRWCVATVVRKDLAGEQKSAHCALYPLLPAAASRVKGPYLALRLR